MHATEELAVMGGKNPAFLWMLGTIEGGAGAAMQTVLASPSSPRYLLMQVPHVLVILPHGYLFSVAHSESVASRQDMELTIEDATLST